MMARKTYYLSIHLIALIMLFSKCQNPNLQKTTIIKKNPDSTYVFLIYGGLPDIPYESAKNVIASKWNIMYKSVAQCMVPIEIKDSADKFNDLTTKRLSFRYGKNWEKRFDKEIKEEKHKQKIARALLDSTKQIIEKRNEMEKDGNGLDYDFYPTTNYSYEVDVSGWGRINDSDVLVIYYKYSVDIKKKETHLLSDTITRW